MDLFIVAIIVLMMVVLIGTMIYLDIQDEKYWMNEVKEGRARIIYIRRW